MMKLEVINTTEESIKELKKVVKVLKYACKKEKLKRVMFNLIIVDNNKIQEINKSYRNKNQVTDVITFALEDEDTVITKTKYRILGDIYISLDKAKDQALEYEHSLLRELSFLAVHGFYHLLVYDHLIKEEEEVMFKLQEEVLERYEITR